MTTAEAAERLAGITASIVDGSLDLDTAQAAVAALQAFISARNASELEAEVASLREQVARLTALIERKPQG
jgi:hypothetical protein